jgi:hypothetical protein
VEGPLKRFRDRCNTFKLEDGLKTNSGLIGPSYLNSWKNMHLEYTSKLDSTTTLKIGEKLNLN